MISGEKVRLRGIIHENAPLIYQWLNREDLRDLTGAVYDLNRHKIYLHVLESYKRAIRCYEKAGYCVEGSLFEHHFGQGKYCLLYTSKGIDNSHKKSYY